MLLISKCKIYHENYGHSTTVYDRPSFINHASNTVLWGPARAPVELNDKSHPGQDQNFN